MNPLSFFKSLTPKRCLILMITLLSVLYSLPNFYGEQPALQVSKSSGIALTPQEQTELHNVLQQGNMQPLGLQHHAHLTTWLFRNTDAQLQARDLLANHFGNKYQLGLNLAPMTPAWLQSIGATPMKLGLDLRGGVHLLLDVDVASVMQTRQKGDLHQLKTMLRDANLHTISITKPDAYTMDMAFASSAQADTAAKTLGSKWPDHELKIIEKGSAHHVVLRITPAQRQNIRSYLIDKTIITINKRVNELGVSEAVVQRQGQNYISVDLPGIQDAARAKAILGKTATLRFHLQDMTHDPFVAQTQGAPMGSRLFLHHGRPVLLENFAVLKGDSITYASATMRDGRPAVTIRLGGGGENRFNQITGANIGRPLAVVYVESKQRTDMVQGKAVLRRYQHEKVINIATIQSALGTQFEITGIGSRKEAEDLSLLLRSGSLAAPVTIIQETTIGPSLGKANIVKGVQSLEVGALLVIVFMLAYYRLFGLVANLALILNVFMILALLSLVGMTLTLPGIAGIVLTVGMAVDANVLINERIREELRLGMSPLASIKAGYERAFSTIVDANITTLIVALILFGLGSGSVKGFAVTLSIGLLCSMLTAITFTRVLVDAIYTPERKLTKLSIGV